MTHSGQKPTFFHDNAMEDLMSLYVISKSRYDQNGTLTHVEWAMADGERAAFIEPHTIVSVDSVV